MDPLGIGIKVVTNDQLEIINECMKKESGGLHLPLGKGKTLISLILGLKIQQENKVPFLVIASKNLIPNWESEIQKWFGDSLPYEYLHQEKFKGNGFNEWKWKESTKLILTTPQVVSKAYKKYNINIKFEYIKHDDFGPGIKIYNRLVEPVLSFNIGPGLLYSINWPVIIIDEVQDYTKASTQQCSSLSSLYSKHRWLLSGTMFEEHTPERLLGFFLLLNHPRMPRNLPDIKSIIFQKNSTFPGLKESLIYREKNEEFIPPKVNREIVSHKLTIEESNLYLGMKKILKHLRDQLEKYKDESDAVNTKKFSSYIMAMITYLRQSLVCPLIPITSVAIDTSDFHCKSQLSEMWMNQIKDMNLDKWFSNEDAMRSSRISEALKKVENHKNERILIFSCFRSCLEVLTYYLKKEQSYRVLFTLTGDMSTAKRAQIIEDFSKTENAILLLTYKVGSSGLNLQCANVAILIDFWWNQCKSNQAIGRILRRGQKSPIIYVYYFTSDTGIENCLFEKQKIKKEIGLALMDGSTILNIPKLKLENVLRILTQEEGNYMLNNVKQIIDLT